MLQVFLGAVRAQAGKLEIVTDNFVNRCAVKLIFDLIQGGDGRILHPVALHTTDMVVFAADAVIPLQGAAELELLYFTQMRQHFQVAVYSAEAYPGQALPDPGIQFVGTGMIIAAPQLFKDNHPLLGRSETSFSGLFLRHGFDRPRVSKFGSALLIAYSQGDTALGAFIRRAGQLKQLTHQDSIQKKKTILILWLSC